MSIIQHLIDYDREVKEIRERLRELSGKLAEARRKARNFTRIEEIQERLSAIELEVMGEITREKDENGKPVFSNEQKRKVELKRRLEIHPEYQQLLTELKELKQEKVEAELEYEMLRDEFRRLLAEAHLIAAEASIF